MPVGQRLADERRARGKSMADICAATRIMASKIDALEHDRHDDLPAPVYVRGYISAYAKALGLDPAPFLAEYERDLGPAQSGVRLSDMPEMEAVVPLRDQLHTIPRAVWLLAIALVIAGMLGIWAAKALSSRGPDLPPVPPAGEPATGAAPVPGVAATSTPDTSHPATADAQEAPQTPQAQPFSVSVAVAPGAASWLRVTIDGRIAYEGILTGSSAKEWTAEREAVIRAGKPSVVTVLRDGTPVPLKNTGGVGVATLTASP